MDRRVTTVFELSSLLGELLQNNGLKLALAESCTGGLLAGAVTAVPGSSAWFERGFVTYTNTAKMEMLGVSAATLQRYGAVSTETAAEMVQGAVANSHAEVALSVTGIAGPDGGSAEKPVGTVCFGCLTPTGGSIASKQCFAGDRAAVRQQSVKFALSWLIERLG